MQQRARAGDPQTVAQFSLQRLDSFQNFVQVGAPNVAAVDNAGRQNFVVVGKCIQLLRSAYQVDVQAVNRQGFQQSSVFGNRTEVSAQQDFGAYFAQSSVNVFVCFYPLFRQVNSQSRLVDLNPLGTGFNQSSQDFNVNRQQFRQQAQTVEFNSAFFFTNPQESQRTNNGRFGFQTQSLGFLQLLNVVFGVGFEFGIGVEFRHQVVVVGVEPFGHFDSELVFVTTGQLEELFQRQVLAVEAETGRDGTGGNLQVEDVVVESEIACSNEIGVGGSLVFPVFLAQVFSNSQQFLLADFFAPVFFLCEFQFAEGTDAREA